MADDTEHTFGCVSDGVSDADELTGVVGSVNANAFHGWEPGSLLCLGVQWDQGEDGAAMVSMRAQEADDPDLVEGVRTKLGVDPVEAYPWRDWPERIRPTSD